MATESDIIGRFSSKKIVIVGDPVADQFLRGTIDRVSREAPVFILRHDETETLPGGAANAAANVASLGANAVLVGVTGADGNGDLLKDALARPNLFSEGVLRIAGRKTATKVRVLAGQHYAPRQQVIRIDFAESEKLGDRDQTVLLHEIKEALQDADAVILSDYGYGTVTGPVRDLCTRLGGARGIPVLVDSRHDLRKFRNATSATPNQEEVEQLLGDGFDEVTCEGLRKDLGLEALLITLGNKGMLLIEKGTPALAIPAVGSNEPVDVTGAGDTVIAAYALALASGADFPAAARIANRSGGIVVMKRGTAAVTAGEILNSFKDHKEPVHPAAFA